jgi:hypothetical protein
LGGKPQKTVEFMLVVYVGDGSIGMLSDFGPLISIRRRAHSFPAPRPGRPRGGVGGGGGGPAGEWRDSGRSKRTAAEHLIRSSRRIDRSRRTKAAAAAAAGSGTAVGVGEMEWAAKRGYWSEGFAGSN